MIEPCPLCAFAGAVLFFADTLVAHADFFHCPECDLIFKSRKHYLDASAEKQRYDLHNNIAGDAGYERWLKPALTAVVDASPPGSSGLDYGCGPGPVLSQMLSARGYSMRVYDPYFARHDDVFAATYDFITCTEAIEHFYHPLTEVERMVSLLKPGGVLVLMTGFHRGQDAFKHWHYRIDPTHVCFFSTVTFEWLARRIGFSVEFAKPPAALATFRA